MRVVQPYKMNRDAQGQLEEQRGAIVANTSVLSEDFKLGIPTENEDFHHIRANQFVSTLVQLRAFCSFLRPTPMTNDHTTSTTLALARIPLASNRVRLDSLFVPRASHRNSLPDAPILLFRSLVCLVRSKSGAWQ